MGPAMVTLIKTANKSISRLCSTKYPRSLSPEDELAIKNKEMCWACKEDVEGSGETPFHDHNYLGNPILSGGSNFRGLALKL